MDFFNSDTSEVDREYLRGLKECDSKTKELLLNNHKMCNALVANSQDSIAKKTMLTTVQLPSRLMKNGLNCKGPCMLKCDIAAALQNQIGAVPETCIVTKINLLNCNFESSDDTRKLHVAVAGGAASGMYMECRAQGYDEESSEPSKSHLLTLNSGAKLNDVGCIYDQSDFLENPVFQRYRAALNFDPHKDRSDINAKVSGASSSFYTSPYMRNIGSGAKDVTEENGIVSMKLEGGEVVTSQGDYLIDLMSKNLAQLPGVAEGGPRPIAQWVDPGNDEPEVLQIKTTVADCDKIMDTVQSAILGPLRERTINLSKGEGLTLKMQTTAAPSELSNGEVAVTDWPKNTSASMTLAVEVAYDKNEINLPST